MSDLSALGAFLLGSVLGSFLNVVILRYISTLGSDSLTHQKLNLGGRSHCPRCQRQLRWWELVPIISFIFLRGRCASCHTEVSVQYPLVELAMGLIVLVIATPIPTTLPEVWLTVVEISIAAVLVVLFMIDLKTMLLPDIFVGVLLGLVVMRQIVIYNLAPSTYRLADSLWGVGIGAGFLFFLWAVTRGRGIGLGDVKLMIPLGVWTGLTGSIALLFIAYMVGGVVACYLLARKQATIKSAMPFGPFLCGAALMLLLMPHLPEQLTTLLLGYNPWLE